jgi:hypothetical protein
MKNTIIVSTFAFGSIYLFSTSLVYINLMMLEKKPIQNKLLAFNCFILGITGSALIYLNWRGVKSITYK